MSTTISVALTATTPPSTGTNLVPHTKRTTVFDAIEYAEDALGGTGDRQTARGARRAVGDAIRELQSAANWTYLYQHGRVFAKGQYTTGTVRVQTAPGGGLPANYVTLTGGTFPSWAARGVLRIGLVVYDVDKLIDPTHCTLKATFAPAADVAAGAAYTIYNDTYLLPEDFQSTDNCQAETALGSMTYVHPQTWLETVRSMQSYSNTPRWFSIMGDPQVPGRLCLKLFPYPDVDTTIDFLYHRRPRALAIDQYTTGTATVDAINSPTTITGVGTAWTQAMVGSVVRLSQNSAAPTGFAGGNQAVLERNVLAVGSATSLTTDDAADGSLNGVAYRISDPIDVEDGAMLNAFWRCLDKHMGFQKRMPPAERAAIAKEYAMALMLAREADSRVFGTRVAGGGSAVRQRLARMPTGPDVS